MMKQTSFDELRELDRELVQLAARAMQSAYAPYSKFAVGAAIRTNDGKVYSGANLENAVYGLGICAEVSAMASANTSENHAGLPKVQAIAVVGGPISNPSSNTGVITPCGRCRQIILEAAQASAIDIQVFSCSGDLSVVLESKISELLPNAFDSASLVVCNQPG